MTNSNLATALDRVSPRRWLPYTMRRGPRLGDVVRQHVRRGRYHDWVFGKVTKLDGAHGTVRVLWNGGACEVYEDPRTLRIQRTHFRGDYRRGRFQAGRQP